MKQGWYAVYTRSRHEQKVEQALILHEITTYLPKKEVWSTRRDRRRRIDVPALPGYLFIQCDLTPELRATVKKSPSVVGFVCSNGQPARIPDDQIESLRILLASDLDVQETAELAIGQAVHIRSGPLKGATGVLERVNPARHRLVIRIEHIGLALTVDLHEADVELAEPVNLVTGKAGRPAR